MTTYEVHMVLRYLYETLQNAN